MHLEGQLYSIIIAHVALTTPTAMAIIQLRLSQMPASLEEAAWNLGATEWQALWKVILPSALAGIAGGWLLAFTFSFDEFVIAWFVSGFPPDIARNDLRLSGRLRRPVAECDRHHHLRCFPSCCCRRGIARDPDADPRLRAAPAL